MEDWNKINLIKRDFKNIINTEIKNITPTGEIIMQRTLKNKSNKNWLADNRSLRSFIDIHTAEDIVQKREAQIEKYNGQMKFKCFNNKDIPIVGRLHMDLSSGLSKPANCNVLVVQLKSQNIMGRDILAKLGLTLIQQQTNKDQRLLKQPVLTPAAMWDMERDSDPELNVQFKQTSQNALTH